MRVLLINPKTIDIYEKAMTRVGVPLLPPLNLAVLGAALKAHEIPFEPMDLNLSRDIDRDILDKISDYEPSHVGITCLTPSFNQVKHITDLVKSFNKKITVIGGGPHISAFPKESLECSKMDIAVVGEGDVILPKIVQNKPSRLMSIERLYIKNKRRIIMTENTRNLYVKNLDELPMPSWDLFKIKRYKTSYTICKKRPVGPIETSRGCPYGCKYCNKNINGRIFRAKSPERVVEEIERMLDIGFREIHTIDDGLSTDMKRAKNICKLILKKGLNFPWNVRSGIRVDRTDEELLLLMKKAGCYRISFGVESGSQRILNNINKGTTIKQNRKIIWIANRLGIETMAFFMLGLPGETERTMKQTIRFAHELNPTFAKIGIATPLPGTPMYKELEAGGYITSKDWSKYTYHDPSGVYNHPNLSWKKIHMYYSKFYRSFYFNPSFLIKRIMHDLLTGNIITDIVAFLGTKW